MIDEIEVGKKYRLIDKEGFVTFKGNGNYNRLLLNDKNVFDENMCVVITTERVGCGGNDEKKYIISPNEYHLFELVDEDNEQEHVQTKLKNKKLIDLLVDNDILWPKDAEGAVQDVGGWVKFYVGEKPTIDAAGIWCRSGFRTTDYFNETSMVYIKEIASDYNTAVITKTDWENRKVDKKPMFADIKVGDKVWDIRRGWGVVSMIIQQSTYPIEVDFESGHDIYSRDGYYTLEDINPSLFWDEIEVKAPPKPLPDLAVDTKVFVWDSLGTKLCRHFSHFDDDGVLHVFVEGRTSFTGSGATSSWSCWKIA